MAKMPFRMLLTFLTLSFLAVISFAQNVSSEQNFFDYHSPGKTFRCLLPKGWGIHEIPAHSLEVTGVDGVLVYMGNFENRVTISVNFFPKDNKLHKNMERYIAVHSGPVLGVVLEGQDYGSVSDTMLNGVKGKTFRRTIVEYESHVFNQKLGKYVKPLEPRKVSLTEKFVVIPAGNGFAAFRYKSPPQSAKVNEPVFSLVMDSFTLLIH